MRPGGRREAPTVDDRGGRAGHLGRPLPGVRPGAGSHDGSHAGRLLWVRIEPRGAGPACGCRESRWPHLGPARQRRRRDRGGEATSGARPRACSSHSPWPARSRTSPTTPTTAAAATSRSSSRGRGVPVAAARGGRERPRIRRDLPAAVALVGDADRPDEPEPVRRQVLPGTPAGPRLGTDAGHRRRAAGPALRLPGRLRGRRGGGAPAAWSRRGRDEPSMPATPPTRPPVPSRSIPGA